MNEPKQRAAAPAAAGSLASAACAYVVPALTFGAAFIACVTSGVKPLTLLERLLFSYFNNTVDPHPLIYFNGWIHFVPELVGYLARSLPLTAQFAIYLAVGFTVTLVMQREVQKLLALWFQPIEAVVASLVVLVYFQFFFAVFKLLVWCVWLMAIAACCHILRSNVAGQRYRWTGLGATAAACLSNPVAVVFVPLLAYFGLTAPNRTLQWQNLALAILLVAWFVTAAVIKPAEAHYFGSNPIIDAARVVWLQMKHPTLSGLFAAVALAVLAWLTYAAYSIGDSDGGSRAALVALAYVGGASFALYLFSSRAALFPDMPLRYTTTSSVAALLAVFIYAARRLSQRRRRLLILATAAAIAASEIFLAARANNGLHASYEQFLFIQAADTFRKTCRPGETLAEPWPRGPLPILCARIDVTSLPVSNRDPYGNTFVQGPTASVWGTAETRRTLLLAPRR